jgi:thioredoxin-related protein
MKMPRLIIVFAAMVCLGAAVFTGSAHAQLLPVAKDVTNPAGFWTTDWDKAMAASIAQKKPIIVDFYTDWCTWCKKLDEETYKDPQVQKRLKDGWIGVRINPEDTSKRGTLNGKVVSYAVIAKTFSVEGYPTLLFLDKNRKPVGSTFFEPADRLGVMLDYVKDEVYTKNVAFDAYLKQNLK